MAFLPCFQALSNLQISVRDSWGSGVFKGVKQCGERRPMNKDKTMKTTTLFAIAVTSAFAFAASARADSLLSPKAQAQADSLKKVAAPATMQCCAAAADRPTGNARAWEQAQSLRKVPSTGDTIDLARAPRPAVSPKDPRYETAWRANATKNFQVAPVK